MSLSALIFAAALAQPAGEAVATAPANANEAASLAATAAAAPPPVAPAPADAPAHGMTTAEQIAAYLQAAPTPDIEVDGPLGVTGPARDGKPHGIVEVGVGTGGYRSVYMESEISVGEKGTLSIAVGQQKGRGLGWGGPYGYGYGYGGWAERGGSTSVGLGLSFSSESRDDRLCQRQPLDGAGQDVLPSSIDHCRRDIRRSGRR